MISRVNRSCTSSGVGPRCLPSPCFPPLLPERILNEGQSSAMLPGRVSSFPHSQPSSRRIVTPFSGSSQSFRSSRGSSSVRGCTAFAESKLSRAVRRNAGSPMQSWAVASAMLGVSPRNELRRLSTAHSKLFNRLNSTAVISTVTVNCTCLSSFANVSDIAQATTLGNRLGDLLINFLGAWLAAFDRANRNSRVFKCVSASDDHE